LCIFVLINFDNFVYLLRFLFSMAIDRFISLNRMYVLVRTKHITSRGISIGEVNLKTFLEMF